MPLADSITVTAPAVFFTLAGLFALAITASGVGYALSHRHPGLQKVALLMKLTLLASCLGAAFCLHIALLP